MRKIKTEAKIVAEYPVKLLSYDLSYLFNNDPSGISEEEVAQVDKFMQQFYDEAKRVGGHVTIDVPQDENGNIDIHFGKGSYGLAGDIVDATIYIFAGDDKTESTFVAQEGIEDVKEGDSVVYQNNFGSFVTGKALSSVQVSPKGTKYVTVDKPDKKVPLVRIKKIRKEAIDGDEVVGSKVPTTGQISLTFFDGVTGKETKRLFDSWSDAEKYIDDRSTEIEVINLIEEKRIVRESMEMSMYFKVGDDVTIKDDYNNPWKVEKIDTYNVKLVRGEESQVLPLRYSWNKDYESRSEKENSIHVSIMEEGYPAHLTVYGGDDLYGGAEEGGWWYKHYHIISSTPVNSPQSALRELNKEIAKYAGSDDDRHERKKEFYANLPEDQYDDSAITTGSTVDVSGQYILVVVEKEKGEYETKERPHYEGNKKCLVSKEEAIGHSYSNIADHISKVVKRDSNWREAVREELRKFGINPDGHDGRNIIDMLSSEQYFDTGDVEFEESNRIMTYTAKQYPVVSEEAKQLADEFIEKGGDITKLAEERIK